MQDRRRLNTSKEMGAAGRPVKSCASDMGVGLIGGKSHFLGEKIASLQILRPESGEFKQKLQGGVGFPLKIRVGLVVAEAHAAWGKE